MTYDEVVTAAAKLDGWYHVFHEGIRRVNSNGGLHCPLTAVAHACLNQDYETMQFYVAAKALNVNKGDCERIVYEADSGNDELLHKLQSV